MSRALACVVLTLALVGGDAVAAAQPSDPRVAALVGLARTARDQGRPADAVRYFRDADARAPFDRPLLIEYFWAAKLAGAAEAVAVGERVLAAAPGESRVRDGVIGLVAGVDEAVVLRVAQAGAAHEPTQALWPRRLAERYLRTRQFRHAAAAYARAAGLAGGEPADRAQAALALELAGDAGAVRAWGEVPRAVWSTQTAWADSRARALAPADAPVTPAPPPTPAQLTARARRSLAARPCAEAPLEALEILADGEAFITAVEARPPACERAGEWTERGVERAIAVGAFPRALALARRMPEQHRPVAVAEQIGVLLHWLGDDAAAEPVLRDVLAADEGQRRARVALVEVYRARGNADAAWAWAEPIWSASPVAAERLALGELALETGRFARALELARAVEEGAEITRRARILEGRALLALGQVAESAAVLAGLVPVPTAALAWLETVALQHGSAAALARSAELEVGEGPEWLELLARRAVWLADSGQAREAARLVARVAAVNTRLGALAEGDVALAAGRPLDAENAFRRALSGAPGDTRSIDGLSTALAEQGRWTDALMTLRTLRDRRPHDPRWALREADWRHRQAPTAETRAALEAAARHAPVVLGRPALARAHARDGALARVVETLGSAGDLSEPETELLARSLAALGRSAEALDRLRDASVRSPAALLLRAELEVARGAAGAADAIFSTLTARDDATPAWYLAWADHARAGERAVEVLTRGAARFPDAAALHERLAVAAWSSRDAEVAGRAAERALALDDSRPASWFVLVEMARAAQPAADLSALLDRFETRFAASAATRVDMANMLAGLTRAASDLAAQRALGWMDGLLASEPTHVPASLAQARLLAATGQLAGALAAVERVAVAHPDMLAALRLRAELLAWTGRYTEALTAFDIYLAQAPADVAAARLQARVEGWRGHHRAALARYAALAEERPDLQGLSAEVAAKRAAFAGRWDEARPLYEAWIAVEPADVEAQLEWAQALHRLGEPARAVEAFRAVMAQVGPNDVALSAAARLERRREAVVDVFGATQSNRAALRQQLLDVTDAGVGLSDDLTLGDGVRARVYAGPSRASAPGRAWTGVHVGAHGSALVRPALMATAGLAVRRLAGVPVAWWGDAATTWRANARLRLVGGIERAPLLDNGSTLERGIDAWGPRLGARWGPTLDTAVELSASVAAVSDGNRRQTLRLDAAHRVLQGEQEVRLLAVSDGLGFRDGRATYFAPRNFWRHDAGVEWRRWLAAPRFYGDRERWVSAGYLIGVDNRGEWYQTFRGGASYEMSGGLSLVGEALLVRAQVYTGTRVSVGLRMKQVPAVQP
jgi:tetratricopeptide (TPR) repeat protein